jgi:hypothetical protein
MEDIAIHSFEGFPDHPENVDGTDPHGSAWVDAAVKGKVRDIYSLSNEGHLLFVATDRISAYNVILRKVCPVRPLF